jgi:hypothetical protein
MDGQGRRQIHKASIDKQKERETLNIDAKTTEEN